MENTIDLQQQINKNQREIISAINGLILNALVNNLVFENVVMGHLKINDDVPIDTYLHDLGIRIKDFNLDEYPRIFAGASISNEIKVINKDLNYFCKDFYYMKMNNTFFDFILKRTQWNLNELENNDRTEYLEHFPEYIANFILNLYPTFKQIAQQKIEYEFYDVIPLLSKDEELKQNTALTKLLINIAFRGKRVGAKIDRYVKQLVYVPKYLKTIIKNKKGHYYIINNDIESMDYKIAFLSAFDFKSRENYQIWYMKLDKWIAQKFNKI